MITDKEFYLGYQADYFAYKQIRLKRELEALGEVTASSSMDIFDYSLDDHKRSIKIDMRQTYFQAIETVFELIFSFKPTNGILRDDLVLQNLIKRKDHYEEIRDFANDKGGLDFLEHEFKFEGRSPILALQYLFFGFLSDEQLDDSLSESLQAIRKIIKIIATDISDRKEYNAYKHGLRIFPVSSYFSIHEHDTMKEILKWDLKDSMSFIEKNEKTGQIDVMTKLFDPERDYNLSIFCNNLISNIIMVRRSSYQEKGKRIGIVKFDSDQVSKLSKSNVPVQNLKFSSTPINQ